MNQVFYESKQIKKRKHRVKYNIKKMIMILDKIRTNRFDG